MDLHYIQLEIIKRISLLKKGRYSDFQIVEIEGNLFAYHLKKLIDLGYVLKQGIEYSLTVKGKMIANKLEMRTGVPSIYNSPKVSIKAFIFDGEDTYSNIVLHERLKEPFFGYVGVITGRINYEDTFTEALHKEVGLKTNLIYDDFFYNGVQLVRNSFNNEIVENKIFHIFTIFNAKGILLERSEGFRNYWATLKEFECRETHYAGQLELLDHIRNQNRQLFIESDNIIDNF